MARDIHNVTDDVSLVMREVIDATENAMVLETALHLNKGAKSANAKDYIKTQVASKRQLNNKLQQVANKSQKMLNNVIDNIGSYTGTDTKQLKKDTASGMKMLVRSAKSMQNKTLKKVSRLERYATSAQFIPNLDKSIISQTKTGIDKGLPVTYKNGRKVTYKAYMEMAVRTGIQQEIGNRQLEAGKNANIVFYVVNEFGDCADDHADYQGKMYYDEGFQDFPLRDEIKGLIQDHIQRNGLLSIQAVRDNEPYLTTRPNCRHKMKPVAIDRVLKESVEDIKDDLGYKTKSYRPENYEATKEQRYNERNIRKYKQRNLTYMALYKKTNNKQYLLLAQKEKRQAMLWQKRQRQHMKANPDLFRDYERENPRVLLQDLGLTNKKIQVDPNKPPTPITNKPPQNPPVPMSATVQEHLEVPEQNLTEILTSDKQKTSTMNQVFTGRNLLEERDVDPDKDAFDNDFMYNLEHNQYFQRGFDEVPSLQIREDFNKELEKSPYMLFRGYSARTNDEANSFREDMETGIFYVDNSGGAVHGRGMYFAFAKPKQSGVHSGELGKRYANDIALEYATRNGHRHQRIDIAYVRKDAKIAKSEEEIYNEYKEQYNRKASQKAGLEKQHNGFVAIDKKFENFKKKFDKEFKVLEDEDSANDKKINELHKRILLTDLSKKEYKSNKEALENLQSRQAEIVLQKRERHNELVKIRRKRDEDKNVFLYENQELKKLYQATDEVTGNIDVGVAGVQLGYDGYEVGKSNYFVLLNRSQIVLLDNDGDIKDPIVEKLTFE